MASGRLWLHFSDFAKKCSNKWCKQNSEVTNMWVSKIQLSMVAGRNMEKRKTKKNGTRKGNKHDFTWADQNITP